VGRKRNHWLSIPTHCFIWLPPDGIDSVRRQLLQVKTQAERWGSINSSASTKGEVVNLKFNNQFSNRYERCDVAAHDKRDIKADIIIVCFDGFIEFLWILTWRRVHKVQPLTGCQIMKRANILPVSYKIVSFTVFYVKYWSEKFSFIAITNKIDVRFLFMIITEGVGASGLRTGEPS